MTKSKLKRNHAIIIGGGFGGLVAGEVLSKYYEKVTIIERDSEPSQGILSPRDGVPQGAHAHFFIPKGLSAIHQLLPNYIRTVIQRGAHEVDLHQEVRYSDTTNFKVRFKSSKRAILMSRVLTEDSERSLVKQNTQIEFKYHCLAKGLLTNYKENRITGVRLQDLATNEDFNLYADLVVDASGNRSIFPEWLEALGYDRPTQTSVKIDYIQLSRRYRLPSEYQPDWKYTIYRSPLLRKGGYVMRLEDDQEGPQWLVAFVRHFGEPITNSEEGFLEFAKTVVEPDLYDTLKKSKPITPIKQYTLPASKKYRYSKLKRLPSNFLAIGDATSIWPPHAGLGMAMACETAVNLDQFLAQQDINQVVDNRKYFSIIEKIIDKYWDHHLNQDVIPIMHPKKSIFSNLKNWYKKSVGNLCNQDPKVWDIVLSISLSERSPSMYYHPAILYRVILNKLKGK